MSTEKSCERHVWASVGVVSESGAVYRVWECENCPVWTLEPFDAKYERSWDDTWLAGP